MTSTPRPMWDSDAIIEAASKEVARITNGKTNKVCLDCLSEARLSLTFEDGVNVLVDDTLFWEGYFHGSNA